MKACGSSHDQFGNPTMQPSDGQEPADAPAISVRGVSKEFHRPRERYTTLREHVLSLRRDRAHRRLQALDDVTFDVAKGEFFGIIGRNGSGKSTLLRCLSQIYLPDRGQVRVEGRIAPFIELGVGFDGDMAARDNVIVNAVLLGIGPREARRRFDEIIEFAELEDFVDLKLKNYSSGMTTRLAFAVTVNVDADVLLLDEVLAVGDAGFQQKCYAHFEQLRESGRTVVIVTHDKALVERFCDRVLLLHHGQVVKIGEPRPVLRRYSELIAKERRVGPQDDAPIATARIDSWFEDGRGTSTRSVKQDEDCTACVLVSPAHPIRAPVLTVSIENGDEELVFAASAGRESLTALRDGESSLIRVRFSTALPPGQYRARVTLLDGTRPVAPNDLVATLLVLRSSTGGRSAQPAYEIEVGRP